ncbi:YmfQ family protein [Clostridium estertheticum]|uniref:YmfQ family protein n=1 Tax=Clostridium estertheticum TaxID=238834 RepID=UPI001CF3A05F|nr:YmfQ family protein [Clostridium estertheticum]MCB2309049.1 YmfQ family protein [Clostridium estertheticum]MCB2346817.1 YmfQ family protein [Clostridium estertheticum]MCB2351871.1 YmfQ family protein [Clostridium estertheticum]WAG48399.1 YmfQ family protein [Clostridium estertheticum]
MRNEQLYGEIQRINLTWNDLIGNTWGDFKPMNSTIESVSEIQSNAINIEVFKANIESNTEVEAQGINVEFSPIIIKNDVEMIVSVSISKKNYKKSMIDAMPLYYRESKVIDNVLGSTAKEFKRLEFNTTDAEDNLFIDTTISQIERWEKTLGIAIDNSKQYDFRREKIKSKLRATGTTTKAMIKNVASAFSNGEVEVIEDNANYKFIVKFTGVKGIPKNMEDLTEILEELKPAHLGFEYSYTYNTWGFVANKTWGSVSTKTWADIQTFE